MWHEPLVRRLAAHGDVFAALVAGVDAEEARWRPTPEQWSIVQVVNHLADEEVEDFRARLDATLHRPADPWAPIDPEGWARERGYQERDLGESLERFLARRRESVAWLRALERPDRSAAHEHPRIGRITAGDLLTSWVGHDHIHVRQINRLRREYLVSVLSAHSPEYAGRW